MEVKLNRQRRGLRFAIERNPLGGFLRLSACEFLPFLVQDDLGRQRFTGCGRVTGPQKPKIRAALAKPSPNDQVLYWLTETYPTRSGYPDEINPGATGSNPYIDTVF